MSTSESPATLDASVGGKGLVSWIKLWLTTALLLVALPLAKLWNARFGMMAGQGMS